MGGRERSGPVAGGRGRAVGRAVHGEVRGVGRARERLVARPADAAASGGLPDEVVPDGAKRRPGVGRVHGEHEAEEVAPALAHLLQVVEAGDVVGAAGKADRDPVAVLVHDDARIKVSIGLGHRVGAEVHLHPGLRAIGGGKEIRVAISSHEGSVLRFSPNVVVPEAARPVVVHLEVAAGGVEPVVVHDVVDDVAPVEEVGDRGRRVVHRVQRKVERGVEHEPGAAVGAAPRVRHVVAVAVRVGGDVVAARGGELGASSPVRVVPPEGGRRRVVGAGDHRPGVTRGRRRGPCGRLQRSGKDGVAPQPPRVGRGPARPAPRAGCSSAALRWRRQRRRGRRCRGR